MFVLGQITVPKTKNRTAKKKKLVEEKHL